MSITAQATANMGASPQDILEFVLDLNQYRQVDPKISRVISVEGPDSEGQGSVKIWGKLNGKTNGWKAILNTLTIHYGDRIADHIK